MNKRHNTAQVIEGETVEAEKQLDSDKVYGIAELMQAKRKELEALAKARGIEHPNVAKNKRLLADAIMETQDGEPGEHELTPKQEAFCQLYAGDREFFGNGVQSYAEAYGISLAAPGAYESARVSASRLLTNVTVLDRIYELMADHGYDEISADKSLAFWMRQQANPGAAVSALKIFYEKNGKIGGRKGEITNNYYLLQQNNQIHFTDPKAAQVIENFDKWLMDNTLAPAPQEGAAA